MQLDLDLSRKLGEIGIARSQRLAERKIVSFTERAARTMLAALQLHGPMSGEAMVDAAKRGGFDTGEDRAFGACFRWLSRRALIKQVGECPRTKGHGCSGGRVWAAT
jgi:hypothetical protein